MVGGCRLAHQPHKNSRYSSEALNPGEEPTCRLLIEKDTTNDTKVSLYFNRQVQAHEDLTIAYGGPYWQMF
jgi:hypothetical protein